MLFDRDSPLPPDLCFGVCNSAYADAQEIGKTPALCVGNYTFLDDYTSCRTCVNTQNSTSETSKYITEKFFEYLDYCGLASYVTTSLTLNDRSLTTVVYMSLAEAPASTTNSSSGPPTSSLASSNTLPRSTTATSTDGGLPKTSSAPATSPAPLTYPPESSISGGAAAAVGIGVACGVLLLAGTAVLFLSRRRRRAKQLQKSSQNPPGDPAHEIGGGEVLEKNGDPVYEAGGYGQGIVVDNNGPPLPPIELPGSPGETRDTSAEMGTLR